MTTKKETRGAKLKGSTPRKAQLLNIDEDDTNLLLKLGNGNKSEGLHQLCKMIREIKQNTDK